jgi:hypothetical protein
MLFLPFRVTIVDDTADQGAVRLDEEVLSMRSRYSAALVAAATSIALAAVGALPPAGAAEPTRQPSGQTADQVYEAIAESSDPSAAYAALTPAVRDEFDDRFLPATYSEEVQLSPVDEPAEAAMRSGAVNAHYSSVGEATAHVSASTQGCWGSYVRATMKAAVGNALWDTYTEGTWCASGSKVTSATFSRSWSTIAALGWRDGGQLGKGAAIVSGQARIWSQRKMILGAGGWDIQTSQPCVRMNGTSAGGKSTSLACSIY